jgi:hypothetical protein
VVGIPGVGKTTLGLQFLLGISVPALATSGDAGPGIVGNDGDGFYQG